MVIAVAEQLGGWAVETADETACRNEDFAGNVPGQITGQVGVDGRGVLRRGRVQCAGGSAVVQQATPAQSVDVP